MHRLQVLDQVEYTAHVFTIKWTDDADYEHLYEDRLYAELQPFFDLRDKHFKKSEVDFHKRFLHEGYEVKAEITVKFNSKQDLLKWKLIASNK